MSDPTPSSTMPDPVPPTPNPTTGTPATTTGVTSSMQTPQGPKLNEAQMMGHYALLTMGSRSLP